MKYIFSLLCVFVSVLTFAQDGSLARDERGKLIHYEVVDTKGFSKSELADRAARFFKQNSKRMKLKSKASDSLLQAEGKMLITKTALVLNRPSGEVKYNFYVECRDDKYRFWLTDFSFIPYQRDRYGNFTATTTVAVPLEADPGKLNAAEWKGYVSSTAREAEVFSLRFKEYMLHKQSIEPAGTAVKTISTNKW